MDNFHTRSKSYLSTELKDAFHDFYVTVLDRAEKQLYVNKSSKEWSDFRFSILNIGNNYIREVDKILDEYIVEFRPAIFSVAYKDGQNKDISPSSIGNVEFGWKEDHPYFAIGIGLSSDTNIFKDLADAIGCGKVYTTDKMHYFIVSGMYNVFHKLIPWLTTSNSLRGKALDNFNVWKNEVYSKEGK